MSGSGIEILRLGHRRKRDERLTTHVCLTARALGADKVLVAEEDSALERTIESVVDRFGGSFVVETGVPWKSYIRDFKGTKVHLTMYGEKLDRALPGIPKKNLLVIVGSEKVPGAVYDLVDYNVSVGNQPHSEVAALAIFLDRLLEGKGLNKRQTGGKIRVIPTARGKRVERNE
jgi:tRNA (cytidine56-2'-O)-methyltransferase